jgi:hypothetical protein
VGRLLAESWQRCQRHDSISRELTLKVAAARQLLMLPMKSKVASLPLVWYALRTRSAASRLMGSCGWMAREGPHAMVLPKRNSATPSALSTGQACPWP